MLVQSHRHQHVARLGRARMARRPSTHRHALQVQRNHQRFALHLLKTNVRGIRHARRAGAIYARARNLQNSRFEPVAQPGNAPHGSIRQAFHRQFRGLAQSHDAGHILRARALPALMAPAHNQRLQWRPAPHIHRAHALRPVHLVCANRAQVAPEPPHVERDLPRALHRIDVEERARIGRNFADLFHRLQHAGLVIRQHHADQSRLRPHRPANLFRIDQSIRARRNKRHLRAALRDTLCSAQHR